MALTSNTLTLQLARVRLLVQEPTAAYWSDAALNQYINEAQSDIATGCVPGVPVGMEEPLLASETTLDSIANQELYSLPSNYHGVRTLVARGTSTEKYAELPLVDIEYVRVNPKDPTTKPEAYFLWAEQETYQLGLYPAFNSANGRLQMSYWRWPTELTSGGSVLTIPPELHNANAYLAAYMAWFERAHQPESEAALKRFVTEYQAKLAYIRRRQINQKRAIMVGVIGDTDTERELY